MPFAPGSRLGPYEIVAPLGKGGMGEVYRAKDPRLGREIALKVLPEDFADHPERLARFEREARTVAALNHPNIVTLHSIEDDRGVRFLTMELVEGSTLADVIVPGGIPVDRLLELAIPLAAALTAAHERGIVHRDLKPGNVMVTRDGRVKVLDFGLARTFQDVSVAVTAEAPLSREGFAVGTVPYMAPEQLRGETVDARADLFAMGIVLYELATGRRPFTGETSIDVSHAILRVAPEPLHRVRPDLPADLERIVGRCLEKEPRARVQTALDLDNELRTLRRLVERGEARPAPREKLASIAVLPFVNRSANADDEYFADGLADEILNVLAKIRGLKVSARTSSFQFRSKDVPLPEIGGKLGVETVLDGTVRKAGDRVRVAVQLVSVASGDHLWSETYDRTVEDIFAVQDDIAHSVVKELRTTLLGERDDSDASGQARADVAGASRGRSTSPEAHRLFLEGRFHLDRRTQDDVRKGIEKLEAAVALDPNFAAAWAELGRGFTVGANLGVMEVRVGYAKSRNALARALVLEPDLAEAHSGMGWIALSFDWDWDAAKESFDRAVAMAPNDALNLRRAAALPLARGDAAEAVRIYELARDVDPLSAITWHNLGIALHRADRLAESEAALRKVLELNPQNAGTHGYLAGVLVDAGRPEDALAEAQVETNPSFEPWSKAIALQALGRTEESRQWLERLLSTDSGLLPAEAHAFRGETDQAFAQIEKGRAGRYSSLTFYLGSPQLRSLHGDPRWAEFRALLHL
jgi:serine/threonine protein kinase/Tfp pilus assembly protein PilF